MKLTQLALPLLLAALVTACGKPTTDAAPTTTDQQLDQLKQNTGQAMQDMKTYTYAEKDAFVAKMQTELDALNQELAQLTVKIANASDAVKADAQPKIDALRVQIAELGPQLDNAKSATESTWDQVKSWHPKSL